MHKKTNDYDRIFKKFLRSIIKISLNMAINKSVGQLNIKTIEKRLSILSQVGDLKSSKILDFGCGIGYIFFFKKRNKIQWRICWL